MLFMPVVLFMLGVLFLWQGAEKLVEGSSKLALRVGVSPLVVGLTVIAFGTSSPELAVSLISAIRDAKAIALGNIIGSNVANLGLVIGISALIQPLKIESTTIKREMPILIGATALLWLLSANGSLGLLDGIVLLGGFGYFMRYMFKMSVTQRKDTRQLRAEMKANGKQPPAKRSLFLVVVGLVALVAGSYWIVKSAVVIAEALGVSQVVIGITMVAVGTSLPELAISAVSAIRNHSDIAVGNAVGSNIFNTLFVIAIVAVMTPIHVESRLLYLEYPMMLAITLVSLALMHTGKKLVRWEAGLLLGSYSIFIYWLFMQ